MKAPLTAALALLIALPAAAQEWQVARETFAFAGSQLTIRVTADAPGTLQVIRGAPGAVQVASRSTRGFTAAGLSADEELTLATAGPGPVDYLVSVPEDVWIDVRLPGRGPGESMTGRQTARSFQWDGARWPTRAGPPATAPSGAGPVEDRAPAARPPGTVPAAPPEAWLPEIGDGSPDGGLYTTFARPTAPPAVALPELANIRVLTVRIEGTRFQIMASRPLSVREGSPSLIEIRPASPPMELVITVPAATTRFRLDVAGTPALVLDGDTVATFCSPSTEQWLSNERRWLTFNPVGGALECSARSTPRHEG